MYSTKIMCLGSNIRLIRKKWGLSQEELGKRFDLKGQSISTYEKGTAEPNINFLIQLSEMAGISINVLCLKHLEENEAPESPLYGIQRAIPSTVQEPFVAYESPQAEGLADPRYNMHVMVSEFKKLEARVRELEAWNKRHSARK